MAQINRSVGSRGPHRSPGNVTHRGLHLRTVPVWGRAARCRGLSFTKTTVLARSVRNPIEQEDPGQMIEPATSSATVLSATDGDFSARVAGR